MAKSILGDTIEGVGQGANAAADYLRELVDGASAAGRGLLDDAFPSRQDPNAISAADVYQGNSDQFEPNWDKRKAYSDQNMSDLYHLIDTPGRIIDNQSEFWFGKPLILPRDTPGQDPNSPMVPVKAGVSDGESRKALTKLADAQSRVEDAKAKATEVAAFERAQKLKDLMAASKAAPEDTFVGDSSGVSRGGRTTDTFDKGSFSRGNKPIADYGDQSTSKDSLQKLGLKPEMAQILARVADKDTQPQEREVLMQALKLLPDKQSDAQKKMAMLQFAAKYDKINSGKYIRPLMQMMGISPEELDQMLGKKPKAE